MSSNPENIERIVADEGARALADAQTPPTPFRDTRPAPTSDGASTMRDAGKGASRRAPGGAGGARQP